MDVGIPMKVEIQRSSSGDLTIKPVHSTKNCADVGTNPVSAKVPQTTLQTCSVAILLTVVGMPTPYPLSAHCLISPFLTYTICVHAY